MFIQKRKDNKNDVNLLKINDKEEKTFLNVKMTRKVNLNVLKRKFGPSETLASSKFLVEVKGL